MKKLTIGITAPVFDLLSKRLFELSSGEKIVYDAIYQQEIIISDRIIEYYKEKVKYPEMIDSIISGYGNQKQFKYMATAVQNSNGIEELLYLISQADLKILVGEKEDVKPYKTNKVQLVQTSKLASGKKTAINNYVFPVNLHLNKGYSCDQIISWFSHLFKGEKKIDIQDKFILNEYGLNSLKKYYLPHISSNTEINIYSMQTYDTTDEDIEKFINEKMFDDYNINVFLCSQMKHDRYIELEGIRIKIGAGLDILGKGDHITHAQECDIDVIRINEAQRLTIPNIIKQIR